VSLLRGPVPARIDALLGGKPDAAGSDELHLATGEQLTFGKVVKDGRAAVLLITARTTSIGMAWAQLKAQLPALEALIP
jgi:hypothetical protein